jgi:hypothetical protein
MSILVGGDDCHDALSRPQKNISTQVIRTPLSPSSFLETDFSQMTTRGDAFSFALRTPSPEIGFPGLNFLEMFDSRKENDMAKIKNTFVAFGVLSLVIVLISVMTPTKTQGQGGNQHPLNVNVVNSPNVQLTDLYPAQPFQRRIILTSLVGECVSVPADKGLIIELVTAQATGLTDELTHFILGMNTIAGGQPVDHRIILQEQRSGANVTILAVTQPLRAYADPGTDLRFRPLDFDAGPTTTRISVSGQLVNAP